MCRDCVILSERLGGRLQKKKKEKRKRRKEKKMAGFEGSQGIINISSIKNEIKGRNGGERLVGLLLGSLLLDRRRLGARVDDPGVRICVDGDTLVALRRSRSGNRAFRARAGGRPASNLSEPEQVGGETTHTGSHQVEIPMSHCPESQPSRPCTKVTQCHQ